MSADNNKQAKSRRKTPCAAPKAFEQAAWDRGLRYVAGVDEVGRGPLAGPVVAAAVIMPPDLHIPHVTDSKRLLPGERERLAEEIQHKAIAWAIGLVSAPMIDACNILRATHLAMREALRALDPRPELILVDGWALPDIEFPQQNLIGGDSRSFSIAAASIVAKVARDRIMCHLDSLYPQYGFAGHKGYSCASHFRAIEEHGPCPVHRLSFSPFVATAQEQFDFENRELIAKVAKTTIGGRPSPVGQALLPVWKERQARVPVLPRPTYIASWTFAVASREEARP